MMMMVIGDVTELQGRSGADSTGSVIVIVVHCASSKNRDIYSTAYIIINLNYCISSGEKGKRSTEEFNCKGHEGKIPEAEENVVRGAKKAKPNYCMVQHTV